MKSLKRILNIEKFQSQEIVLAKADEPVSKSAATLDCSKDYKSDRKQFPSI